MKMQEDAINRVKEMQKRATLATQDTNRPAEQIIQLPAEPQQTKQIQKKVPQQRQSNPVEKQQQASQKAQQQTQQQKQQQIQQPHQAHKTPQKNQLSRVLFNNLSRKSPQNNNQSFKKKTQQEQDVKKLQNLPNHIPQQEQNLKAKNPLSSLLGGSGGFASLFGKNGLNGLFGGNGKFDISNIIGKLDNPESSDQILLIALLILLSDEDADKTLLFAILYIMME